VYSWSMSLI